LSINNLSQSNSLSDFGIDNDDNILEDVVDSGKLPDTGTAVSTPSDWNNVSPNQVIAQLKLLKAEICEQHSFCPFYKSYSNWKKLTADQQNKSLAWFCKLPEHSNNISFPSFVSCITT
jgi:hypothetical protein